MADNPPQSNPSHLHFGGLPNQLISPFAPYSALILTVVTVIIALARIYGFDLLLPRLYPKRVFAGLDPIQRRSFINHHVAAATKVIVIVLAAYPFLAVANGASPNAPMSKGSPVVNGDMLIVVSQTFCGMYIFELFYRDKISPISCAHHIGAIVIAQAALALTINWAHEEDAIQEFILCFVWGAFDVVAEFWPHVCMIIYRVYPENHRMLMKLLYSCTVLELVGTTVETGIVLWLFGSLWGIWSLSLKIVTPILHVLFTIAQLWGAWILWGLAKHHRKLMRKQTRTKVADVDSDTEKGEIV